MARGMLSSAEMDVLKKNPYVEDVYRQRILYTYEFKCFFMEQYPMELTDRMKVLEKRSNELVIEKEVLCKARKIDRELNNADGRNNTELYQLIREAAETCPEYANVTKLCEALKVSVRGYYAYYKN